MPGDLATAREAVPRIFGLRPWLGRQSFPQIQSAIAFRAGRSARMNMMPIAAHEGRLA